MKYVVNIALGVDFGEDLIKVGTIIEVDCAYYINSVSIIRFKPLKGFNYGIGFDFPLDLVLHCCSRLDSVPALESQDIKIINETGKPEKIKRIIDHGKGNYTVELDKD